MPSRKYSALPSFGGVGGGYRYGFNGQENSDEIAAGLTTAMYWEYDSRIGRRWNRDPEPQTDLSDYVVNANNPIHFCDHDGNCPYCLIRDACKSLGQSISNWWSAPATSGQRRYLAYQVEGMSRDTHIDPDNESYKKATNGELYLQSVALGIVNQYSFGSGSSLRKGNKVNKIIAKPDIHTTPKSNSFPKVKGQINSRHELNSNSIAKAGKTQSVTLGPKSILDADIAAYNSGSFTNGKNGNVIVNGNTYGIKNEGKTLYPVNGKSFTSLSGGQVQAIQFYKTKSGDGLTKALDGAKVSQADRKFAQEFIKKY